MIILIVGNCGSGKTWVLKQLLKKHKMHQLGKVGMFYFHRINNVLVLGKYDGSTFEGSDRLSMAVMRDLPEFLEYVRQKKFTVVCEGDRFTNSTFINSARPKVIRILDDGKKGRAKRKSNQTDRQIKSIATRVSKLSPLHDVLNSKVALEIVESYIPNN